ncbi:pentapeptide repeat-containing protein [Massilibacteroides vaginae]|uniref:pentapeptide repeat-containing protein n=1 Tax=Massilibacteroides vaginae TaxID=1673718 RepID=UPI000A1CAD21|nr:pentapeptide repeat-containing protein [Massilibacteroides vaginae]
MPGAYIHDEIFEREDFTLTALEKGEYESCAFNGCNFAEYNLSGFNFINCAFTDCNLSLAKLDKTAFQDVVFTGCKMLGLQFDMCNEFSLSFSFNNCLLNHSVFYKRKIKKTSFLNSQLREVDFTEADLSNSVFDNCDLLGATFEFTNLEKADLRTAYNFTLDPEGNRIKKAAFSLSGLPGLLNKYELNID